MPLRQPARQLLPVALLVLACGQATEPTATLADAAVDAEPVGDTATAEVVAAEDTPSTEDGEVAGAADSASEIGDIGVTDDTVVTPPRFEAQDLFVSGSDGYGIVRIPALITTTSGALLAFVEGRQSIADDGDIDIVLRRSDDDGATWSPVTVVVDLGEDTAGNPTPLVTGDGRVLLPYTTNPGSDATKRSVWLVSSDDDGHSWSAPRDLTAEVVTPGSTWYATGPGRGIALSSGRLLIPADHVGPDGVRSSHVILSDDGGEQWYLGGSAARDTDEAQAAELSDGRVLLNMRFEGATRARAIATSTDGGLTFSETTFDARLPDPGCEGSLLATDGALWFSNPATVEVFPRDHLTVRVSHDDGATWAASRVLDPGPSAYSALTELSDGRIGILWEQGELIPYDRIRFARFDTGWVNVAPDR